MRRHAAARRDLSRVVVITGRSVDRAAAQDIALAVDIAARVASGCELPTTIRARPSRARRTGRTGRRARHVPSSLGRGPGPPARGRPGDHPRPRARTPAW
ncbi:MAG: hypothetical protein R2695_19770 [Acidimicrobiales bacterium]